MKKKINIKIIISSILLLVLIFSSTYAIITLDFSFEDLDILATTPDKVAFTAVGGDKIAMNIHSSSMQMPSSNITVGDTSDTIDLTLTTDGKDAICCSYDFMWKWDTTTETKNQYVKTPDAVNEYVLSASFNLYEDVNKVAMPSGNEMSIVKQLPNYGDSDNVVFSGTLCNRYSDISDEIYENIVQRYTIKTFFYNLTINQDDKRGATFVGKLEVGNISCAKAS